MIRTSIGRKCPYCSGTFKKRLLSHIKRCHSDLERNNDELLSDILGIPIPKCAADGCNNLVHADLVRYRFITYCSDYCRSNFGGLVNWNRLNPELSRAKNAANINKYNYSDKNRLNLRDCRLNNFEAIYNQYMSYAKHVSNESKCYVYLCKFPDKIKVGFTSNLVGRLHRLGSPILINYIEFNNVRSD